MMTDTQSVVADYAQARMAYESAQTALTEVAADYVDAHPELDTTGEWARMRALFGESHRVHWDVTTDEDSVWFSKTTNRGLVDHDITVKFSDLAGSP